MMKSLNSIVLRNDAHDTGRLNLTELPSGCKTTFISITGQDGSGKTSLRDNLAKTFAKDGLVVITAKSPCDPYLVHLLNNAISQNGYSDEYTEQLLFAFADGLLSNYMKQLDGHCDLFICQRGPLDMYCHGITRQTASYADIYKNQQPERLAKFDIYLHLNCKPEEAWKRVKDDDERDRYEYPEYFKVQSKNTEQLFLDITKNVLDHPELNFLRESEHHYLDTTKRTIMDVFLHEYEIVVKFLEKVNAERKDA